MRVAVVLGAVVLSACGASFPTPPSAPQPEAAFVEVPYPPPPALPETVPPRPRGGTWIDGQWTWDGTRWDWAPGGWVLAARGVRFARWALHVTPDGRFLFAAASWRDASGRELAPPPMLAPAVGEDVRSLPLRCP